MFQFLSTPYITHHQQHHADSLRSVPLGVLPHLFLDLCVPSSPVSQACFGLIYFIFQPRFKQEPFTTSWEIHIGLAPPQNDSLILSPSNLSVTPSLLSPCLLGKHHFSFSSSSKFPTEALGSESTFFQTHPPTQTSAISKRLI